MTDTAKEVMEVRRHLDELRYHFLPVRHDEKASHVVERTIALITTLQARVEALEKERTVEYEAACSGLRYTKPGACGEVSAIFIDGVRYKLEKAELGRGK
jgi:hypothetical protein